VTYDALVIGAGPAGSTAALLLARAGWSVAVVEKSRFPRRKVCGEFISATSLPVLRELGLEQAFLAQAGPEVRRVGFFAGDMSLASPMPQAANALGWGRALGREQLDLLLLQAAAQAGAKVWQPWRVTRLRRSSDGYACAISTKGASEELATRILIAANGSWERNPVQGSPVRAHKSSDLLAFKAHFVNCDLPTDLMPLVVFPGGYGGLVHSGGGRVSLSCCIRRDEFVRCRERAQTASGAEAVAQHIAQSCEGVRHALRHAHLADAWLSAGPIRPGIRKRHAEGLFFVGNAAGEAHPIIAEGISMAMQSAWLLCRGLIARRHDLSHALPTIGRQYASEWRTWFAPRIYAASVFAHAAMNRKAAALGAPILKQFPAILTFGAQLSGKAKQMITPAPARHGAR
jgi:flavin-dependent dehydrogenase